MSEPEADRQDKSNADGAGAVPATFDLPTRSQSDSAVRGGKTVTVFGALFGAAAAVPT